MSPCSSLLPLALLACPVAAQAAKTDAATTPDLTARTDSVELTWVDFDADGLVDALTVAPEGQLALLRRRTDETFEDATSFAGLAGISKVEFVLAQDYDEDELVDLVIGTQDGSARLWKNFGGSFTDVTAESGLDLESLRGGAQWIDYDNDGHLDLATETDDGGVVHRGQPGGGFRPERIGGSQRVEERGAPGSQAAVVSGGALTSGTVAGGSPTTTGTGTLPFLACAPRVLDDATGNCMEASSDATLGMLFPISEELYVDSTFGLVGINDTSPNATLAIESAQTPVTPLAANASLATLSVASRDSLVAAIGQTIGGHSASYALREVSPADGSLVSTWGMIRETTNTGALKFTHGADGYPGLNPTIMSLETDGGVGIGTETPTSLLSVAGDADIAGKLAIGTSGPLSPSFFLEARSNVNGGVRVFDFPGSLVGGWFNEGTLDGCTVRYGGLAGGAFWDVGQLADNSFTISNGPGAVDTVRITPGSASESGRVGIGTTTPTTPLDVNGNVRASGLVPHGLGDGNRSAADDSLQLPRHARAPCRQHPKRRWNRRGALTVSSDRTRRHERRVPSGLGHGKPQ